MGVLGCRDLVTPNRRNARLNARGVNRLRREQKAQDGGADYGLRKN